MINAYGREQMHIPAYQIHNVMNAYSRNLIREITRDSGTEIEFEWITAHSDARKAQVIQKIVENLTRKFDISEIRNNIPEEFGSANEKRNCRNSSATDRQDEKGKDFVYHEITGPNSKAIKHFSVNDPKKE